jgi:hypothetical protein
MAPNDTKPTQPSSPECTWPVVKSIVAERVDDLDRHQRAFEVAIPWKATDTTSMRST